MVDGQWIPLISAGIGGLAAIIVMLINQIMSYIRWKEELKRKGEDKYLEKRLEYLHDAIIELHEVAYMASELAVHEVGEIYKGSQTKSDYINNGYITLNKDTIKILKYISPYLDDKTKMGKEEIYKAFIFRDHRNTSQADLISDLIYSYISDLENLMRGNYVKQDDNWIKRVTILSVIANIFLIVYIIFV